MKTLKSIIIDDEPSAIENLERLLKDFTEIKVVKSFTIACQALNWLLENQVDVIFLDVEMPGKNGFEFLKDLDKYPETPCIVFTTGYAEYAMDAIKAAAFDFLLKPIAKDELEETLQRFKLKCHKEEFQHKSQTLFKHLEPPHKIIFAHNRGFVAYQPDEIMYIEAARNYSQVYIISGKKETVSMQLGQIEKATPSSHFFRINRSIIINLRYFTHADQKLKKCYLEVDGKEFIFPIKANKIKTLQQVMMGP